MSYWVHPCTCRYCDVKNRDLNLILKEIWIKICVAQVTVHQSKALSKGNSCTFDRNHKQRSSSFSASGNNGSISSYAKTYVINVCSAACSICASVFLASPHSLCQCGTAEGPSWSEWAERETGRKTMRGSASTRASAPACEPLTCIPGCEECVLLFATPIKFIFEGDGKQIHLVSLL